jgi:predicted AAA+ superfamily ATPase
MTPKIKLFNTTGPCFLEDHYMLPPLSRITEVKRLIDTKQYFVLHAPRQSGKTTAIQAAVDQINQDRAYCAMYYSLERLDEITDRNIAHLDFDAGFAEAINISEINALKIAF